MFSAESYLHGEEDAPAHVKDGLEVTPCDDVVLPTPHPPSPPTSPTPPLLDRRVSREQAGSDYAGPQASYPDQEGTRVEGSRASETVACSAAVDAVSV